MHKKFDTLFSANKCAAKLCERFPPHLNDVSTYYLVKREMLIANALLLSCHRNKLQNLSHLTCSLQIRHIQIQTITACGKYCRKRCTKQAFAVTTDSHYAVTCSSSPSYHIIIKSSHYGK